MHPEESRDRNFYEAGTRPPNHHANTGKPGDDREPSSRMQGRRSRGLKKVTGGAAFWADSAHYVLRGLRVMRGSWSKKGKDRQGRRPIRG